MTLNKLSTLFVLILAMGGFKIQELHAMPKYQFKDGSVHITQTDNGFTLYRNGKPYIIKGVGTEATNLSDIAAAGGNSIRTWRSDDAKQVLDDALSNGLSVTLGLWMVPERHGFDYDNPIAISNQLEEIKEVVLKYKDHPALLIWGIGNELNLSAKNDNAWKAVNEVAKMIHKIDPNHPAMTVMAGMYPQLLKKMKAYLSDVDVIGINSYGYIGPTLKYFVSTDWNRPFIVTEWGPKGWWEVPWTIWGAPIEPLSGGKLDMYTNHYQQIQAISNQCFGSYSFLWGWKQEKTSTWFGLLLDSGEYTEAENGLYYEWNGQWPENRAPNLTALRLEGKTAYENVILHPVKKATAEVTVTDFEGDKLTYEWTLQRETRATNTGGDAEPIPETILNSIIKMDSNKVILITPKEDGAYRLFVKVRDGHGNAATGNIPFYVE